MINQSNSLRRKTLCVLSTVLFLTMFLLMGSVQAQSPNSSIRLRASIEKIDGGTMTLKERNGEILNIAIDPSVSISECLPIDIEAIKPGSFIGSGALPQLDGTLKAVEVLVFPESMRGAGEGHRAWDVLPQSTMTNATVSEVIASSQSKGRTLQLRYKDGEKTLVIPSDAPIVTFIPGDRALLVIGAKLIVTVQEKEGKFTATRIIAGRNGFQPPM